MKGKVYLVGAGPGDYGLLTLKGLECIKKADVIVYDRLANEDYLKEAKPGCEYIYVGKVSSNHTLTQDEINQVIMEKAKAGNIVTRLKGGDPYVFGRGGEEGEYLLQHGVRFEVVPGITSAIGGLCYAGIPITHRDYTSSFHVVTGHLKDDENTSINWNALAHMGGTIVFLMGVSNLAKICSNLMAEGMAGTTSAAVINWATRPNQKVVTGNLETICEVVEKNGITSPSLIVVGEVVKLREKLNFFEEKPLFGQTIVTTRARAQSSTLKGKLQELGAKVIEFPTICIKPLEDQTKLQQAIAHLEAYTYLVFTSQNAVSIFFEELYAAGKDARALGDVCVVAVGKATKDTLKQYGILADKMPERFIAESVCDLLESELTDTDKILIPKATKTRDVIQERLSKYCEVEEVEVYENVIDDSPKDGIIRSLEKGEIDAITFTSASTVKNFMTLVGDEHKEKLAGIQMVSIGAITSETMRNAGLQVDVEPAQSTIDEMIQAMLTKRGEEKCE
ncbi:MAG: uroporphyrinogen-III C-methyltransferase [Cellulosilyticaceae bacterium]